MDEEGVDLVKCSDDDVDETYGIGYLPRLVYFQRGIPEPYEGDETDPDQIVAWIRDEVDADDLITVTRTILEQLVEKFDRLGVIFVDDENKEEMKLVLELEKSIGKIKEEELDLVLIDDPEYADELGLGDPPTLVHFSNDVPSIFYGEETTEEVLRWLIKQKNEFTIEVVTGKIIEELIEDEEFVAVFFAGECEDEACQDVLQGLEDIDDELDTVGIAFVQTKDQDYPYKMHQISSFPALGLYRNGDFIQYTENLADQESVRKWLMDEDTLHIPGKIEEVNEKLLGYLYENVDDLVLLLYEETDRDADEIITVLETIDDELDEAKVFFVKCSEKGAGENYGILDLPAVVYIQNGIPNVYDENDLTNHAQILGWIEEESKTNRINEVTEVLLNKLIEKMDNLAVVFYDMEEDPTVENLQQIADDCVEDSIGIVKINDVEEAKSYGIEDMPTVLYFEKKIPTLFDGNIEDEQEVLEWILKRKTDTSIYEVTDEMLEKLVEDHEYVAVYFTGDCDNNKEVDCDAALAELETIDDELEEIGILMVTTEDTQVAMDNGQCEKLRNEFV